MDENSIVKVTEAKTGKLKRYEDEHGIALAVVIRGKLRLTTRGSERNLMINNEKLYEIGTVYKML